VKPLRSRDRGHSLPSTLKRRSKTLEARVVEHSQQPAQKLERSDRGARRVGESAGQSVTSTWSASVVCGASAVAESAARLARLAAATLRKLEVPPARPVVRGDILL
jgi:hypothetical protein